MKKVAKRRGGPPLGHPPWGHRPPGVRMPCGWGCGANLTAREIRTHFTICPKRPAAPSRDNAQVERTL